LSSLSALSEDGRVVPLILRLDEMRADRMSRERYLAAGRLPAGRYSGLVIEVDSATLRGEEGTSDLLTPAEPVPIQVPFTIARRQAVVLSLEFDYRASIEADFRFSPVFIAAPPPRPAPALLGLVSSRGADLVTLFDKVSGRVVGAVPTGREPAGLALDEEHGRAYVAVSGDDTVQAIDVLEYRLLARAELRGGDEPIDVALTPDGRTLLVANMGSSTVSFIDALTMVETDRITLQEGMAQIVNREGGEIGQKPSQIIVDRVGQRAYVFNSASGGITVIDINGRAVAGTIATDPGPFRGDFNRQGDRLFVIHLPTPFVSIVDPMALSVAERIYVAAGLTAVMVNVETDRVYLANRQAGSLNIYEPLSLLPIDSIPIGSEISFTAIDDEGNNLYVVQPQRDEVQVLRIVGRKTIARVEVGDEPYDVVLSGER